MSIENTNEIRKVITEEIELVRTGKSTAARANAISNLIGKLIASVKLDIEYYKNFQNRKNLNTPLSPKREEIEEIEPKQTQKRRLLISKGKCRRCKGSFNLEDWQHSSLHWCPDCRKLPSYKNFKETHSLNL